MMQSTTSVTFGELLRQWRQRRRRSQLDLAMGAEISQRHVSFLESGRSLPSREMILKLARHLDVPMRERNGWLTAAGFAPVYRERSLADPALAAARSAVELVLAGYEPFPALAVDRHWTLLFMNRAVEQLLVGVDAALLRPPVNVLRLSLHPRGMAPRILNLGEWREHVLMRLRRQAEVSVDPALSELIAELDGYPRGESGGHEGGASEVMVSLKLRTERGILSFLSTTTVFGMPGDITLAELAIEAFLPADAATARALSGISPARGQ